MALGAYYGNRRAAGGLTDSAFRMQSGGLFGSTDANLFNPGNTSSGSTAGVDYSPGGMPAGGYNNPTNPNFGNFSSIYAPGNMPAEGTGFPVTPAPLPEGSRIGAPNPAGGEAAYGTGYGVTPGYQYQAPAALGGPNPYGAAGVPTASGGWQFQLPAGFGDGVFNPPTATGATMLPKPTAIPGGVRSGGDWAIDPTTLPGWSVEQNRQLSPREQRIEALGGQTSWHGTNIPSAQSPWEARKSLMEHGWDPSMGYGAQNWAAMGVTNPAVAAQLNRTLMGISPMSQAEKQNWQPTVWRSPEQIARARDAYNKTVGLYGDVGRGIAQSLAGRLQQKGYGWLGGDVNQPLQPRLTGAQMRTAMGAINPRYAAQPAITPQLPNAALGLHNAQLQAGMLPTTPFGTLRRGGLVGPRRVRRGGLIG